MTTYVPREELRQWQTIQRVAAMVGKEPEFVGAFLVGSFAGRSADFLSDVDLIVVAPDGGFADAWERRGALHATGALAYWDDDDGVFQEASIHAWLTRDLVLVECLIATPSSGARLAEPFEQLVGPPVSPTRSRASRLYHVRG